MAADEPAVDAVDVPPKAKTSDLPVRTASAVVMLAAAGGALWLGGLVFQIFVGVLAALMSWECRRLLLRAVSNAWLRAAATLLAIAYVVFSCLVVVTIRLQGAEGTLLVLVLISSVIATDVFAYFAGRTLGGPRIAPSVSPSKTWSGLCGGMVGATLVLILSADRWGGGEVSTLQLHALYIGPIIACVAQAGDFLESWVKRKAGVKDSSRLIPGHGGLLDRLDGMLAVFAVFGPTIVVLVAIAGGGGAI